MNIRTFFLSVIAIFTLAGTLFPRPKRIENAPAGFFDLSAKRIDGVQVPFSEFKGNVVLVVNTASHCGFTGQYVDLEKLHAEYRDQGLVVLGFPSDSFNQEYDSNAEIQKFCSAKYSISFPLFESGPVKRADAQPVFKFLIDSSGVEPSWNFNKYLVNREGRVVRHFSQWTGPRSSTILSAIKDELNRK